MNLLDGSTLATGPPWGRLLACHCIFWIPLTAAILTPRRTADYHAPQMAALKQGVTTVDASAGGKTYGAPLPESLGLTRLLLDAGMSAQATLSGRSERTVESLYLSPGLGQPCGRSGALQKAG